MFADKGDIVVVDTVARSRIQVTRTAAAEANPRWARRDTAITFTRGNGLYVVPVGGGSDIVVQLVDAGPAKAEPRLTDAQKLLRDEEQKLLKAVREAAEKKKKDEEEKKKAAPPRFEITDKQSVPDALLVARRPARVPPRRRQGRRRAGRRRAELRHRIGLRREQGRADQGRRRPGAAPAGRDGPADGEKRLGQRGVRGARARAEALAVSVTRAVVTRRRPRRRRRPRPPEAKYREVRWTLPIVSRDGRHAVASVRSADNKDRWIVAIDPATGDTRVLDHEHDDAWVRDMGTGSYGASNFGFLPDGRTVYLHVRAHGLDAPLHRRRGRRSAARALTSGPWEVSAADLAPAKKTFLLTTTEAHPGERHMYTMPIEGGARTRLTTAAGFNAGVLSPDERTLGLLRSTSNRPPEVFLAAARPGAPLTQVTTSPTPNGWPSRGWTRS